MAADLVFVLRRDGERVDLNIPQFYFAANYKEVPIVVIKGNIWEVDAAAGLLLAGIIRTTNGKSWTARTASINDFSAG
jgi:hypothetical protein